MAKHLAYTDPNTGVEFPEAVWLPVGVYIDASGPSVRIDFLAYKDQEAASNMLLSSLGDATLKKLGPLGSKSFTLTQAEFAQFAMSPPEGETLMDVITNACYAIAEVSEQNRKEDPAKPEEKLPFFDGSKDVAVLEMQTPAPAPAPTPAPLKSGKKR